MRRILSWLMVIGVFAALSLRAFSVDIPPTESCEVVCHDHDTDHSGSGSQDPHGSHEPDEKCPLQHTHHHCSCAHLSPLTIEDRSLVRLNAAEFWRASWQPNHLVAPESPVFELDKPPLI